MAMTAKVEDYCIHHSFQTKRMYVDGSTPACVNCIWYEQYHRENRGPGNGWVPTCYGFCLLHESQRGAMEKPCKEYETKCATPGKGRARS